MKVYINGESVPVELEGEKNASEIITALSDFAAQAVPKQFITKIVINETEYSYADEDQLKSIDLETIENLEIETSDVKGISLLSLQQIKRYLVFLLSLINKNQWDENFEKVMDSISWMKEGIDQIVSIFGEKKITLISQQTLFLNKYDTLSKFFEEIDEKSLPMSAETQKQYQKVVTEMQDIIKNIAIIIDNSYMVPSKKSIEKDIEEIIKHIEQIIPKLANIPILFQTGEDKEAMDTIQNLTSIIEKSISLFIIFKESFKIHLDKYTIKEVPFDSFFTSITDHLKELLVAIENNDSVMIGDLLEYEFIPNVEEMKNILEKIRNDALVNAN